MGATADIAAVVFDLDGTLLDSYCQLSERNYLALRACSDQGVLLCVATARPKRLTLPVQRLSRNVDFLTARGVFYNGAELIDTVRGVSHHWMIPAKTTALVVGCVLNAVPDANIAIQIKEDFHSFRYPDIDGIEDGWGFARHELLPFSEGRNGESSKIVAWREEGTLEQAYAALRAEHGDALNIFMTDSHQYVQVMAREATKENALLELLKAYDIAPAQVAAFGDDLPDVGMLTTFGHGIAMGNGRDEAKRSAAYVTRSNNEDGVAHALEHYLRLL